VRHLHQLGQCLLLAVVKLDFVLGETPEVALPLDERIARREVLRETDECVVDRRSPCGWYFAITTPTTFADFRNGRSFRRPSSTW